MKLLFLDIDGVLNDHSRLPNGLSTIQPDKSAHLNRILAEVSDCQIVVSSAWRYYVHNKYMTMDGFTMMLQTHGLNCHGRIHGITDPDPETFHPDAHEQPFDEQKWYERGLAWRAVQIAEYWDRHGAPARCAILDDLPLCAAMGGALFQTDKHVGLTAEIADAVILRLK